MATWNETTTEPHLVAYQLSPLAPPIVPASSKRAWMHASSSRFAYRCLPLSIANQNGWFILNPTEFLASWNVSASPNGVEFRFPGGAPCDFVTRTFGYGIVTWKIPYLFRTPPGYNLVVRGPPNMFKAGAAALEGIVETDWAVATFTMNWKITIPFRTVRFLENEPICMIQPQRRGEIETFRPQIRAIESEPELERQFDAWVRSRLEFMRDRAEARARGGEYRRWQKHYMRGESPGGASAPEHQVQLDLQPFANEAEPPVERQQRNKERARGERYLAWLRDWISYVRGVFRPWHYDSNEDVVRHTSASRGGR